MMMTGQYFNQTQNSGMRGIDNLMKGNSNNPQTVSKTMAQSKIKKQRINRGISNPMQYENSFNSQDYSILNQSAISHDRNQSLQNTTPGAINMSQYNQESMINQRKPTADSTAYTLYKPNGKVQRSKFSSGGSIDEANP